MENRKRLSRNIISSVLLEIVKIVSSFILPRLILSHYGSAVNGMVRSICQFLSVVSFLELGIRSVVSVALYKPLAEGNRRAVSEIVSSARRFFSRIGAILAVYTLGLAVLFPLIVHSEFSWMYVAVLVVVLSMYFAAQYFIGCVDAILLTADQRGYIYTIAQIVLIIADTFLSVLMIRAGFGIHAVKLVSGALYFACPIMLRFYVVRRYAPDYHAKYAVEPITQKWNGIAQHIATMVLENTDVFVLTLFLNLESVSIYSVYFLVVNGIRLLFNTVGDGFQALFGRLIAKDERVELRQAFDAMELLYGAATTFVYGCSAFLMLPFVLVYTQNVHDVNYYQPAFSLLIVVTYWVYSNNIPYHRMILAAGHFRQTQRYFIIATLINIVISVGSVKAFGLIGVVVGTLAAMLFQTGWMIVYNVRHISNRAPGRIAKQFAADGVIILIASALCAPIRFGSVSWVGWLVMAVKVAAIWGAVTCAVNLAFYHKTIAAIVRARR